MIVILPEICYFAKEQKQGKRENIMQDISVLYLSRVSLIPGIGHRAHTHDYWHFSVRAKSGNGSVCAYCWAPGEVNPQSVCNCYGDVGINLMFLVHDRSLYRRLEAVSFGELKTEQLHIPILEDIAKKVHDMNPGQEFVDCAFGYYLQLILATYQKLEDEKHAISLTEKALAFIEENYMHQIRLEDVAEHIGRTTYHTSHLVKAATGMTVVEHVREVRIKNACRQLAYSNIPIEEVISSCGFISVSYFHKVFREKLGTTPNRYRTSHAVSDTFYHGNPAALEIPYGQSEQLFTYIPGARKCIDWKTPGEYFYQEVK